MGKDTREIRREIEETRARMGDTVEALGYKTDVKSRVRDAVNDRVETVKGNVADTVGKVGRALGGVQDSVGGAGGDLAHAVGDHVPDVGSGARRAVGLAAENPLGLALGALALGFLAGLTIPVSDLEAEQIGSRVGPLADQLGDQAHALSDQFVEHGKAALGEVRDAALQAAQTHGQQLADAAKESVGSTGGTGTASDDERA